MRHAKERQKQFKCPPALLTNLAEFLALDHQTSNKVEV